MFPRGDYRSASGYSFPVFQSKLAEFDSSQQSIQGLSSWIISCKDHCDEIVHMWSTEYYRVPTARKLTFLYLANDIMQTSRRNTMDFIDRFTTVIPQAINTIMNEADVTIQGKVNRLLRIWKQRQVLPANVMKDIGSFPNVDLEEQTPAMPQPVKSIAATNSPVPTPTAPSGNSAASKAEIPASFEKIIEAYNRVTEQEPHNLLAADNLTAAAKATLFPWDSQKKSQLNPENVATKLVDVTKTLNAASELKKKMEKDLEARAELVALINQLKDKQEIILASNMKKLQNCLTFLDNIKHAHYEIEEYSKTISGFKRHSEYTDENSPKRAKVNSPPPPLPEPSRRINSMPYNAHGPPYMQQNYYVRPPITELPPPL